MGVDEYEDPNVGGFGSLLPASPSNFFEPFQTRTSSSGQRVVRAIRMDSRACCSANRIVLLSERLLSKRANSQRFLQQGRSQKRSFLSFLQPLRLFSFSFSSPRREHVFNFNLNLETQAFNLSQRTAEPVSDKMVPVHGCRCPAFAAFMVMST